MTVFETKDSRAWTVLAIVAALWIGGWSVPLCVTGDLGWLAPMLVCPVALMVFPALEWIVGWIDKGK